MQSDHESLSEIQREVLAYLEDHPNAADTAEGIRRWWLFQRMAKCSAQKVQQALDQLKAADLIEARRLYNGSKVFGLPRSGKSGMRAIEKVI